MNSTLLFNEHPIVINRSLAKKIGLNASIVLQQLNYWIENNRKKNINFFDGRYWTYNSMKKWHEGNFDFWSLDTLKRAFKELENQKLIITGNYNKEARDRTKWYTIDFEKLEGVSQCIGANCTNGIVQNAPMHEGKMPQPLPEISTEIYTENSSKDTSIGQDQVKKGNKADSIPFEDIIAKFNEVCTSLPKTIRNTSSRRAQINARWKEYKSIDTFIKVFKMTEESDFLSGRNGKWAGCNFDWLMKKSNFLKVLENNYRNVKDTGPVKDNFNNFHHFHHRPEAADTYKELEKIMQQNLRSENNTSDSKILELIRGKGAGKGNE